MLSKKRETENLRKKMIDLMLRAPDHKDNVSCANQGSPIDRLPSAKHYKSVQGPKALPPTNIREK